MPSTRRRRLYSGVVYADEIPPVDAPTAAL
jgi:hypothetical protein